MIFSSMLLASCGYRGDLYLPKENDKTQFGPVQTGIHMQPMPTKHIPNHD